MAAQNRDIESNPTEFVLRDCPECGGEREHEVLSEEQGAETAPSVREGGDMRARRPCRVYRCVYCGNGLEA